MVPPARLIEAAWNIPAVLESRETQRRSLSSPALFGVECPYASTTVGGCVLRNDPGERKVEDPDHNPQYLRRRDAGAGRLDLQNYDVTRCQRLKQSSPVRTKFLTRSSISIEQRQEVRSAIHTQFHRRHLCPIW